MSAGSIIPFMLVASSFGLGAPAFGAVGVGAKPIAGAEIILDGSRKMLDDKWTYWKGPRFASALPIKWQVVDDPVDAGTVISAYDPAAAGGKYGAADIVTKKPYRDFRLHVEFLVMKPGGNSGVYLQNRYEIQIFDGDKTTHGMAAVINEKAAPYELYNGVGKWNAYDITFRAARFQNNKPVELPMITMYFNGKEGTRPSEDSPGLGRSQLRHRRWQRRRPRNNRLPAGTQAPVRRP